MRHRGWVPGEQGAVFDGCRRFRCMRSELPVPRVRGREQANVVSGERLAPARKSGVDLGFGNTDVAQCATDVRRRGVTEATWDREAVGFVVER